MKGFIAIMLLYIQAVASVPPNRRFRWKTKSDGLLIMSPPSEKPNNVAEALETSLPTDMSVNITQKNVTILRVLMHEKNPSREPKEFELRTYDHKMQLLGIDESGIVKKSRKKTTSFMVVRFRTRKNKDEFVFCAIRGKRHYIASLDGSTNGIQLHCAEKDLGKKNKACNDEIKKMRSSKLTPYLFSF